MASTFSAHIDVAALLTEFVDDSPATGPISHRWPGNINTSFGNGTGSGQINVGFSTREEAIGASQTTVYTVIGVLEDLSGDPVNLDKSNVLGIRNLSATYAIQVGPTAGRPFGVISGNEGWWAAATDRTVIPPSSVVFFHSVAGVPATASTTDQFEVVTLGGSSANSWDIIMFGQDT